MAQTTSWDEYLLNPINGIAFHEQVRNGIHRLFCKNKGVAEKEISIMDEEYEKSFYIGKPMTADEYATYG